MALTLEASADRHPQDALARQECGLSHLQWPRVAVICDQVWSKGSQVETSELAVQAKGKPLGVQAFVGPLRQRCLGVG